MRYATSDNRKGSLLGWTRRALLTVALFTGGALVVTVWSGHRSIHRASEAVARSEGERLLDLVRERLGRSAARPTAARLEAILEDLRPMGLRHVAIHGETAAGKPVGTVTLEPPRPAGPRIRLMDLGRRVQMIEYPPPPHPHRLPPHFPPYPPPPKLGGPGTKMGGVSAPRPSDGRPPPPGPVLVIEYEPLQSWQVRGEANRTLLTGLGAAAALLVLTVFFWRALRRQEAADVRRERERRLAALGEMSAVLAHEIRNPLASLKGHAQLLVELLEQQERAQGKAQRVVQEAERLEAISSDLLDFVRSGPLERREVDPAEIVRGAADQLGADRFRIDAVRAPKRCSVDPLRLRQVLTNVMQNALQASAPGDSVEVTVAQERGRLSIRVRDHGLGIPPEERERVFEPFHTSRARGTGLGLAVSRRLVELHGGEIALGDVEDGAELQITIPNKQEGTTDV